MRTLPAFVFVMVQIVLPAAARAQQPPSGEQSALEQLVRDQLRRIDALEARVAQLQQEVNVLRGQQPSDAAAVDQDRGEEPFEHPFDGEPPVDPDGESPNADLPRAQVIDSYGSLRALAVWDTDGHSEVRNNATRLGVRGEKEMAGPFTAFARLEAGINMVANDRAILLVNADPGTPIGQGSQAIASRLGFVGIGTPIGNFSWGKQWSPYYDVAEFTDQLQVFSGLANGAFGAGTDGGLSGTGRAERAVQYREAWGPVAVALQVQNRSLTPNDRQWADAFGGSVVLGEQTGLAVGATYNEVRDGVLVPTVNEPQLGDQAALFGVRFRSDRFYVGGTYAILEQHEVDDLGRRFDGRGWEIAVRQHLTDRIWAEAVYNDLRPDSNHPGDYRVQFGAANLVYNFSVASRLFGGFKFENSLRSDRTPLATNTFAGGLNYTF